MQGPMSENKASIIVVSIRQENENASPIKITAFYIM